MRTVAVLARVAAARSAQQHHYKSEHDRQLAGAANVHRAGDSKRRLVLRQASIAMSLTAATALAHRLRRAVADQRVLAAVASIPRERFVPEELRERAYENVALPIAGGQTISQP